MDSLPDHIVTKILKSTVSDEAIATWAATSRKNRDLAWRCIYEIMYGEPLHQLFARWGKDWRWLCRAVLKPIDCMFDSQAAIYFGDVDDDGIPHGYGLCVIASDLTKGTYEGDWVGLVSGIINGNGTLTSHTGGWLYRGDWVNNLKSGRGVMEWDDGSYYDGDFVADKRHCQGSKFVNEMRHGKGVYTMRDWSSIEATTERGDIVSSAVLKHSDREPCIACKHKNVNIRVLAVFVEEAAAVAYAEKLCEGDEHADGADYVWAADAIFDGHSEELNQRVAVQKAPHTK